MLEEKNGVSDPWERDTAIWNFERSMDVMTLLGLGNVMLIFCDSGHFPVAIQVFFQTDLFLQGINISSTGTSFHVD